MTTATRGSERVPYKRGADASVAAIAGDGHRSEKQTGLAGTAHDIPKPGRANDPLAIGCDEGEVARRQSAVTEALRTLAPTVFAECLVEQRFARCDVGRTFFPD